MNIPSNSGAKIPFATGDAYRRRIDELEAQLAEARETLEAIRSGEVDAVVVGAADQQRIFTLEGADRPYRKLIEEMREGAVTLTTQGVVLYCNRALADLIGAAAEHIVGANFAPFVLADDQGAFENLLRGGGKGELALRSANGRTFQVLLSVSAFAEGDTPLLCGVVTDLTESKAHARDLGDARERLAVAAARREGDERFRLIVDSSTDYAIVATDLNEQVTIWNTGAEKILGWRADEIVGKTVRTIWTPEDLEAGLPEHEMAEAWLRGRAEGERYYRRKDLTSVWAHGLLMPLKADNGARIGFLNILRDRSAQRELEKARLELNETLERKVAERTAELAATNDRLQVEIGARARSEEALRHSQKIEAIGQLTGGVAHDFNNLLMVIRSSADLLRRPGVSEEKKRRYIDAISDTTDRAAKLTSQLLAYARRQPLRPQAFDVVSRIQGALDLLYSTVGSLVRVKTALDCQPSWVLADANQLETALVNLAVNARDAMKGEGELSIVVQTVTKLPAVREHAALAGDFVAISVSDTGRGITSDKLERIFEPFYTTKGVGKGTGLGLSQVFGFCKQSGGDIHVASEIGHGTTFTLYLPAAPSAAVPASAVLAQDLDARSDGPRGRILVVEDNSEVGDLAALLLDDLGYTVARATDAATALKLIRQGEHFDLVFTDVVMPGAMSGLDLARELRRLRPEQRVALTSGYSDALAEGEGSGFELLSKPYSVNSLAQLMHRLVGQSSE